MLGGFVELPATLSNVVEPLLSPSQINSFLPSKGKFTFPAPYNTQGVRLTNAADCGGADCVSAIGYSYWRNINNHVGKDTMLIMIGLNKTKGGAGLTLLQYNKVTEQLTNLGPVFDSNTAYSGASGEGYYFSATLPTKIYLHSGSKILRYDVMTKQYETIVDVSAKLGANRIVFQIHSSNDDRVHSATIKDSTTYASLGCMAYETDTGKLQYFPKKGDYDECQIDRSGKWLVIKENVDGAEGEDNRIIDLATGSERLLRDSDGAGGHSDLGFGYMVANDNWAPKANTWKVWDFNKSTLSGVVAYSNTDWNVGAPNHVTHTNALNASPASQYSCGSSANRRNAGESNEIVCFMLDGSGRTLVVAPVMTNLDSRKTDDYDNMPKGNLDVTGQYFIWTSNMGGSRLDAFLVKVPSQLLTNGAPITAPAPAPAPAPGSEATPTLPVPAPAPTWPSKTGDATPPQISNVSAGLITSNAAAIAWQTSEVTDGSIEYGTTTAYGLTASLGAKTGTTHAHILMGLKPSTTYHYRVQSADADGNASYSANQTFTTPGLLPNVGGEDLAAPLLTNIRATNTGSSSVKVNWSTNEPAQQRVEYGLTTAYERVTTISATFDMHHAVELAGLSPGKVYHYRVRSRDAAGNVATSPDYTITAGTPLSGTPAPIAWTETVNTFGDANGWVRKMSGCDGCSDAGAVSMQKIEGRGYLEFTATVEDSLRFIGLGARNTGPTALDIDYALRLQGTAVEVRENGVYKWDTTFVAGDVFRITVDGGKVNYAKNGTVFYTSTAAPAAVLRGDVALYSTGSGIAGAQIATPVSAVTWSNLINVTAEEGRVRKSAGCDGCADAMAVATQSIENGNGSMQISATVEDKVRYIGLSSDGATLAYSLRLQGNIAEARDSGKYMADTTFNEGDTLRITVENGVVSYVKNGVAFYSSPARATTTLRAAALLYSVGGTVKDAVIRAQ
ncbi:MAG TPA: fibronectin type III domain-containing protein [Pseudomonadales bacterium]